MKRSAQPDRLCLLFFLVICIIFAIAPFTGTGLSLVFFLLMYVVLSQAQNMISGYTQYFAFGHVAFFGVGAYVMAIVWRLWSDIPLALLLAGIVGVLLSLALIPLFKLRGIYFGIATYVLNSAISYVIPLLPEEISGGTAGISLVGAYAPLSSYYIMLILAMGINLCLYFILRSKIGLALCSIRDDPEAASMLGVNPVKYRSLVWILSAFFAAIAGSIFAWHISYISYVDVFAAYIITNSLVYWVFGGSGTLTGPIIGTLVIYTIADSLGVALTNIAAALTGILILIMILSVPLGVVPFIRRLHPMLERLLA